jgi:hypothetical protein
MARALFCLALSWLLVWPGSARARPLNEGITIGIHSPSGPDVIVCTGFCPNVDITVWDDGEVVVNGVEQPRVTKAEAARFRTVLFPFRSQAIASDPSTVFPNACLLKVQWPSPAKTARPTTCGDFFVPTYGKINAHETFLFGAVSDALAAVHRDITGRAAL